LTTESDHFKNLVTDLLAENDGEAWNRIMNYIQRGHGPEREVTRETMGQREVM
jgi:hypothetical protein